MTLFFLITLAFSCLESSQRRISVVYPSDITEEDNIIEDEIVETPSVETDRWSVYWDSGQNSWYFYDKKKGDVF